MPTIQDEYDFGFTFSESDGGASVPPTASNEDLKLLQDKVDELKSFFDKNSLDSLQHLQFNIQNNLGKLELEDETKDTELVQQREEEG